MAELITPPLNYKPEGHAVSPYMRARQEWDQRLGQTVVQAKNWRLAFFSLFALTVTLAVANAIQIQQRKVIPVVVRLNEVTGEPKVIGKIDQLTYQPRLEEIRYFLTHFIRNVRTVPSDPVLVKQNWLTAYLFLRPSAAALLNDMTNTDETSPLKKIGEQTRTIQPISVVQVGGGNSYQVRWSEEIFDKRGGKLGSYNMTGVFSVELEEPTDEKTIMANPLGLFIKDFQWSKEL